MKTHGSGHLPPEVANQISWVVMNAEHAKHAINSSSVKVLDHKPDNIIVACSNSGSVVLPGSSRPHFFPEGRYVVTAKTNLVAAGRKRGNAANLGLVCVREQRRKSFIYAKPPRFDAVWQIDSTETRQAEGLGGLRSAAPVYELEIEAGRNINNCGKRLMQQLCELVLHQSTLKPVFKRLAPPAKEK